MWVGSFPAVKLLAPLGAKLLFRFAEFGRRLRTAASLFILLLAFHWFIPGPAAVRLPRRHGRVRTKGQLRCCKLGNHFCDVYHKGLCLLKRRAGAQFVTMQRLGTIPYSSETLVSVHGSLARNAVATPVASHQSLRTACETTSRTQMSLRLRGNIRESWPALHTPAGARPRAARNSEAALTLDFLRRAV